MDKRELLKRTYNQDGRSCQEIITDSQRIFDIRAKKEDGEQIIREAEEMRKRGLTMIKEADAEEKKEKTVQRAIREFIDSDAEFIEENGEGAKVIRLSEGEKSGKTYIVIKGSNSDKQFLVFYSL